VIKARAAPVPRDERLVVTLREPRSFLRLATCGAAAPGYADFMIAPRRGTGFSTSGAPSWPRVACAGLPLMAAAACGGLADSDSVDDGGEPAVIIVAPRSSSPEVSEPAPTDLDEVAAADPTLDGLPSSVASLVSNPPERLDAEQFDALLGFYCVSCHATPPAPQASDGFWFDSWSELAAGGNLGPQDADRMLSRVVARMTADGDMPPTYAGEPRQLDPNTRRLMLDFLRDVLGPSRPSR
jgi:hypothetical protein